MAEAVLENRLKVNSIMPNFFEELKRKNIEKAQQKQLEKDEKIFDAIRDKIMNKVFEDYKGDIEKNQKLIEDFSKQIEEYRKTNNVIDDSINNALGAAGTNANIKHNGKMNKLNLANTMGTGISATISSLIESGAINQSFLTSVLQCLSPASALGFVASSFTPPLVGPLVSIGATLLTAVSTFIVNKHFSKKANVGLTADYVAKMEEAVKQWEQVNKEIQELNEILINDKAELIQMYKENKSKKSKDAVINNYINTKLMSKLDKLGITNGDLLANYFKGEFKKVQQQENQEIIEDDKDKTNEEKLLEENEKSIEEEIQKA